MKLFDVFDRDFEILYERKKLLKKFFSGEFRLNKVIGGFEYSNNLDLRGWPYKDLSKIREWLGGDLVEVEGDVYCDGNKILESLGGCGLKRIGGNLKIDGTSIDDLGELDYVGGKFYCNKNRFEYFLNKYGRVIGFGLFLNNKKDIYKITDNEYGYMESLDLRGWIYKDLGRIKEWLGGDLVEVKGSVNCKGNVILKNLGGCGLRRIEGDLNIKETGIDDLGELDYVGSKFYCDGDKINYFLNKYGKVIGLGLFFYRNYFFKTVDGFGYEFNMVFDNWNYKDLSRLKKWLGGDLVEIKGGVDCSGNKNLKSLGGCGLKRIIGDLDIKETNIDDLGDLVYLDGKFICDRDKIKYFLNKYERIVGLNIYFIKSHILKINVVNKYLYDNNLYLGDWVYKDLSKVRELLGRDLIMINGDVDCSGNKFLESLGGCGLVEIYGDLDVSYSSIVDLGVLKHLNGKFWCDGDKVEYFRNSRWGEILEGKIYFK